MNLLLGAIENAEGEAAVEYVRLKRPVPPAGSNTVSGLWLLCAGARLPSLPMADGVTLYVSPGFLVPRFHHFL